MKKKKKILKSQNHNTKVAKIFIIQQLFQISSGCGRLVHNTFSWPIGSGDYDGKHLNQNNALHLTDCYKSLIPGPNITNIPAGNSIIHREDCNCTMKTRGYTTWYDAVNA